METETTISQGLRATDSKAKYDAACKRLLSEKMILAWIMKSCLEEYQDCDVKEIAERYIEDQPQVGEVPVAPDESHTIGQIHGMNSEDTSLTEGTITYDIRFTAIAPVSGEYFRLIINVEAQNVFKPGYPLVKRGIYYCSRMISAQYGTEFTQAHYEHIKKVYSIWIAMSPHKEWENTITRYQFVEEHLVGEVKEPVQNYDLITVLMLCLGGPGSESDNDILKLLNVLLSNETRADEKRKILQTEFDIPMTQTLEGRLTDMCNLSDGVEARGIAKGIERGREEGRAEGRAEGRVEGRAEGAMEATFAALKNLMDTLGLPLEQAMAVLKIPESDRQRYADLLAKK